jgi:hypothetical protein
MSSNSKNSEQDLNRRKVETTVNLLMSGRRGRTRTCDPLLRRQMLYPPELRARPCTTDFTTFAISGSQPAF